MAMFANLLQWITRRDPAAHVYIEEVHTTRPVARDPRAERFILICWALIALKHIVVIWVVHRYALPFHQLWVNAPTFLLGLIATLAYYGADE
jgi:hypothetical protein